MTNQKDIAQAFLEVSEADWEALVHRGIAQHLVHLIPLAVAFQDDLEDAKKFFVEVKEMSLPPKLDHQLDMLDQVRIGIVTTIQDQNLEPFEITSLFDETLDDLKKAYTRYTKLESDTIYIIRSNSKRLPKEAFITKVRSYWNYIDDFWPSQREPILGKWNQYFEDTENLMQAAADQLKVSTLKSPHGVLIQVEALLRKRSSPLAAQKASDTLEKIKQYYVEELGLIPAYMGAQGNWKVEKDDCPDKRLPDMETKLTDRFAFCRIGNKKCPSFEWSQGSYVKCKSFVRLKEASLLEGVKVLSDKEYLKQLHTIAETDPFVRMLFVEAERRSGELFYGKVIDERLEEMLGQYPTSNRRGEFKYRVYMVANEPVLVSGKYAVAADKVLLETIGEGERMPKQASTVKVAGPVMRVTFTSNALRDPEFRDFLRKKNAVKSKHCTYDVPFERDEDISFFLSEVRDEFSYKIEVFQIMEDADEFVEKDFGVYRFSDLPLSRFSSFRLSLGYVPAIKNPPQKIKGNALSVEGASKLADVVANLPDKSPIKERLSGLASRLKVVAHILIATPLDVLHYADGAIGLIPEPGARWMMKDPDSKKPTLVEMVAVVRPKQGSPSFKVRCIDTGKEILVKDACDIQPFGPMDQGPPPAMIPPPGMPALPPPPPPPPQIPFGHIIGEDDVYYIVQIPKPPEAMAPQPPFEPSPFGRFPGDEGPALPFGSPGGNDVVQAPVSGPPPAVDEGPVVEQEGVFVVSPEDSNPDFAENQVVEDIQKKVSPKLKFLNAPAANPEAGIEEAIAKLKSMFKGDPRVKEVSKDLSTEGKTVLRLHSTMPRTMKDEVPDALNGFAIVLAPLHDSLLEARKNRVEPSEPSDVTADSLVNPMPNRPENGKSKGRERPPGPYLDQVSEPPPMNEPLVIQVRDLPKGR
jgi:hypothetical protein